MRDAGSQKKQVVKYLIWTFALAYIIQVCAALLYDHNMTLGQLVIAAMMFVPALGVLLSGGKFKDMGWRPRIRKNIRFILIAWFAPAVIAVVGAVLYFLVFPKHFDLSGDYIAVMGGGEALGQMREQGISYPMYVIIGVIASVTYAPLINAFTALGEEIGWRGFLYPRLKAMFGRKKGWLLGGVIWGAWHWPLIWLIGYEYGAAAGNPAGYPGFPVTGMLLFCVITVGLGILHDRLYEKSGSIWVTSIFHGAVNAAFTLPLTVCLANTGFARLLGPSPNGILSALPFIAAAAVIFLRCGNERDPRDAADQSDTNADK
ncbi:MAG: CPBP family intramembrane metalloprotease [Clostridiales bacterium]|nr:CPBP family intramembrane metalloprotease [Clostridiales bacterium]